MRRIIIAALAVGAIALAVFSPAPEAGAQTPVPFMTVDAVDFGNQAIAVTGVVAGDAAPSTRSATFISYGSETWNLARLEACHRALLLALAKPGQYLARVGSNVCTVALAAP